MVEGVRKSRPLDQLDDRAAQPELGGQRQVGGGGADLHADAPGLDDAAEVRADVGELLGRQAEGDRPALAGLEAARRRKPRSSRTGRATVASSSRT